MPASDHLQPYQLKLFMQAHELMDMPASDTKDFVPLSKDSRTYNRKLEQSKTSMGTHYLRGRGGVLSKVVDEEPLHSSIAKNGVIHPVTMKSFPNDAKTGWQELLTNGHHRVSAAHDINPNMYIPVEYLPEGIYLK